MLLEKKVSSLQNVTNKAGDSKGASRIALKKQIRQPSTQSSSSNVQKRPMDVHSVLARVRKQTKLPLPSNLPKPATPSKPATMNRTQSYCRIPSLSGAKPRQIPGTPGNSSYTSRPKYRPVLRKKTAALSSTATKKSVAASKAAVQEKAAFDLERYATLTEQRKEEDEEGLEWDSFDLTYYSGVSAVDPYTPCPSALPEALLRMTVRDDSDEEVVETIEDERDITVGFVDHLQTALQVAEDSQ